MGSHSHRTVDVPVTGGELRVGVWEPVGSTPDPPTALLVHGVTSSHLAWTHVVAALPGVRLIAPDLRGRGASHRVPGPAGLQTHAADLAAALDHLGTSSALVVGHSMAPSSW